MKGHYVISQEQKDQLPEVLGALVALSDRGVVNSFTPKYDVDGLFQCDVDGFSYKRLTR
jgi:hypothetical protein